LRATKLLSSTRNLKYKERLKILNLPTLKYRRVRGDMIELYNIITCKQDNAVTLKFNTIPAPVTRGNTYKIRQDRVRAGGKMRTADLRTGEGVNSGPTNYGP